jgi:hypothetical protein
MQIKPESVPGHKTGKCHREQMFAAFNPRSECPADGALPVDRNASFRFYFWTEINTAGF